LGVSGLRWTIEEWISIWFSQLACTGPWTSTIKLRILAAIKRIWGSRLTTVFPRQGRYALDPKNLAAYAYPPADIAVDRIGDLVHLRMMMRRRWSGRESGRLSGKRLPSAVVVPAGVTGPSQREGQP
jgi:hypothetical protein